MHGAVLNQRNCSRRLVVPHIRTRGCVTALVVPDLSRVVLYSGFVVFRAVEEREREERMRFYMYRKSQCLRCYGDMIRPRCALRLSRIEFGRPL